jgi:peptidoglycan/xylan/chitin deacetylase (PgdA/CDA1 family)
MGLPNTTAALWKARSLLSATARKRVRRVADRTLGVVGSISGARRPTKKVAITFDDGPEPAVTPRLLDLLLRRRVRASFFLLTDRAVRYPDLVRRMAAEGHEVALHADRHDRLTLIPSTEMWRRISLARKCLQRLSGQPVRFFRPPFGAQSVSTYCFARLCGLEVVVWGPHAEDWTDGTEEAVAARGLANLNGGDILLLHDGMQRPAGESVPTFDRVSAVGLILDGMAERSLVPVTVGNLVSSAGARRTAWFRP